MNSVTLRKREIIVERHLLRLRAKFFAEIIPSNPNIFCARRDVRTLRRLSFISSDCLSASMGDRRMARLAGIHADTSAVTRHMSAAASSPHGVMTRYIPTFSPLLSKKPNESRRHHSVIPMPAHPASIPSGMPTAQSTSASYMTVPRICRRVAPIDFSIPN